MWGTRLGKISFIEKVNSHEKTESDEGSEIDVHCLKMDVRLSSN